MLDHEIVCAGGPYEGRSFMISEAPIDLLLETLNAAPEQVETNDHSFGREDLNERIRIELLIRERGWR